MERTININHKIKFTYKYSGICIFMFVNNKDSGFIFININRFIFLYLIYMVYSTNLAKKLASAHLFFIIHSHFAVLHIIIAKI